MKKTYIDELMESLDKDRNDVNWEYFVEHFPKNESELGIALNTLIIYEEFLLTESLKMTYVAVKEVEKQIEFTKSMKDDAVPIPMIAHNTVLNLINTQKRIIGQWINSVVELDDAERERELWINHFYEGEDEDE